MPLDSKHKQKLNLLKEAAVFYSTHLITDSFRGIEGRTWFLTLWMAFRPVLRDVYSPVDITQETLGIIVENINAILTETTRFEEEDKKLLDSTVPNNLPELVKEYEHYLEGKTKPKEFRNLTSDLHRRIIALWEEQQISSLQKEFQSLIDTALKEAKNQAGSATIPVQSKDYPSLVAVSDQVTNQMIATLEDAAKKTTRDAPREAKDILDDVTVNAPKQLQNLTKDLDSSGNLAQELTTLFTANDTTVRAARIVSTLAFAKEALLNQRKAQLENDVIPEALQTLADSEIAKYVEAATYPLQQQLSAQQLTSLQSRLFVEIRSVVTPPPIGTKISVLRNTARDLTNDNVNRIVEVFLHRNLTAQQLSVLQAFGVIKMDVATTSVLKAAHLSDCFYRDGLRYGRVSPQVNRSLFTPRGVIDKAFENELVQRGFSPEAISTIGRFIDKHQKNAWLNIIIRANLAFPSLRLPPGFHLPFLGRLLYQQDASGVISNPFSRLSNNFSIQFTEFIGSSLVKIGSNRIVNRFFGGGLTSLGLKILGVTAGGPVGFAITAAVSVSPVTGKIINKGMKIAAAAATGVIFLITNFLASLPITAMAGGIIGMVTGAIFGSALTLNPIGTIAGGAIGFTTGAFIAQNMFDSLLNRPDTLVGSSIPTASAATIPTAAAASPLLSVTSAPLIAVGSVSALTIVTFMVTSSAFYIPEKETALIGSRYIEITKKVDVGGIGDSRNLPNNVIGEKSVYSLTISASDIPLKDVIITDKTTLTNKNGSREITNRYIAENQGGTYIFKDKVPDKWDKSNDPSLEALTPSASWNKLYGFSLTDEFKDSLVSNTITVEATNEEGTTETKTITLTFKIGNPPLPPLVIIAENLISRLRACSNDIRVTSSNFNGDCVKNPAYDPQGISFKDSTVAEIKRSVSDFVWLQCVGFVMAILEEADRPKPTPTSPGNASNFFEAAGPDYAWIPSSHLREIKEGDIFVSRRFGEGHIGIVHNVNIDGFQLAEALGIDDPVMGRGIVQYTGYSYKFADFESNPDIGFLRYKK